MGIVTEGYYPPATRTVESQLDEVYTELQEIRAMLDEFKYYITETHTSMNDAKAVIEKVAAEVMPTVNALSESPMLKMFLPKKAK